jgi:hypothetical protein
VALDDFDIDAELDTRRLKPSYGRALAIYMCERFLGEGKLKNPNS